MKNDMYLTLFFDQHNYEFNVSLHSSLPKAEAAYKALLRRFVIKPGETLPPKARWNAYELFDDCGESPHVYKIECDGELAEQIDMSVNDRALQPVT